MPYRCNREIKNAEQITRIALDADNPPRVAQIARANIVAMHRCLACDPSNIALWMIAAANSRLLGRSEEALHLYEKALQYDRRPELYFELGLTDLELDRQDDAAIALERAARFDPQTLDAIPDLDMRKRIAARIAAAPR